MKLRTLLSQIIKEDEATVGAELEKNFKSGPEAIVNYLNKNAGEEDLQNVLQAPQADGEKTDDEAAKGNLNGNAMSFAPTQNEIDLMKSVSFPLGSTKTFLEKIKDPSAGGVAADSSAGIIIDGHHRWSGAIAIGGDSATISGTDFELPGNNVAEKLAAAQLVIVAINKGGKVPAQGQSFKTNILGVGASQIEKMIMANVNKQTDAGAPGPLLNDEMISDLLVGNDGQMVLDWLGAAGDRVKERFGEVTDEGMYTLRLAIAQKVAENLAALPQPPAGAPARKYMPQFDDKATPPGPNVKQAAADAAAGKFNIAPPFVQDSVIKTGTSLNESISKDRWAKLANIKK